MEDKNNSVKWDFVAVHRSRVKFLKDAVLVDGTNQKLKGKLQFTSSLPMVFKRAKEHEDAIFFSFPPEFEVKVRKTNLKDNTYSESYIVGEDKLKFFKGLRTEL